MDANSDRMVSGLLKSFPYLDVGQFLFEELRLILNKSPREMDRLLHDANTVMETLAEMVPAAQLKREARSHEYMRMFTKLSYFCDLECPGSQHES